MAILPAEWKQTDSQGPLATNFYKTQEGLKITTGVWGSYIPVSEGYRGIVGAPIWAGTPFNADEQHMLQRIADGGLMSIDYRTWNVKRPMAYAFGYRLNPNGARPKIRRLWIDDQLAYSEGDSVPVKYNNFNKIYLPSGQFVNGVWVPNTEENTSGNTFGDAKTIWASSEGGSAGLANAAQYDNNGRFLGQQPVTSSITFRFYEGSETQTPDQAILHELGADAPSYRGMMYIVIDDLVVGQGFTQQNLFSEGVNVSGPTKTGYQNVLPRYPRVRVELVDGADSNVYDAGMLKLAGSPAGGTSIRPNWEKSQLLEIVDKIGGGTIHLYDADTKAETSFTDITGAIGGERIGGSLILWDTVNDFYWSSTAFESSRSQVTISKNGNVISGGFIPGFDLGYNPSNGQPISETNPTDTFPHFWNACLGWAVVNGQLETVIFGTSSNGHGAAIHVHKDGTFSPLLYPHQIIDVPSGYSFPDTMFALPMWVHATQDQHLSYQDLVFFQAYGNTTSPNPGGCRFVFVGIDTDGTTRIKGTQDIFVGSTPGSSVFAMMDSQGNILFQEEKSGIDPVVTHKLTIDYLGDPDYTVAPAFRGLFPRITNHITKSHPASQAISLGGGEIANVNNNVYYRGGAFLDLGSLDVKTSSLTATGLWDNTRNVVYYNGAVTQTAPDPAFSGTSMRWAQVVSGLLGNIGKLSDVLQDIAVYAGFGAGALSIDGSLVDQVPGVLITSPTDLGTLFNDMGSIYQFSYFNSGGKLTFRSSTNTPSYASGYVKVPDPVSSHVNVQDGDTVTIGTVTYRFKAVPSAPFDVQLGVDTSVIKPDGFVRSLANLYAAIKGDSTLGADAVPFHSGTVVNPSVTVMPDPQSSVTNFGYGKLILTAKVGGPDGNSVALASSSARLVVSGTNLVGGAAPPEPAMTITLDDMCLVGENQLTDTDALITSIPTPGQSQQAASVTYYALEQDYKQSQQTFTPDNLGGSLPDSTTTVQYVLPIVMSTSEAYARVSQIALAAGEKLITQDFRLPQAYLGIEPNDVIGITIAPFQYTVRVDEATFNGDFSMSISGTNFSARTDIPVNNSDSRANVPQTIPNAGDGLPLFIDAPIFNPSRGTYAGSMDFTMGVRPYYTTIQSATFAMSLSTEPPQQLFSTTKAVKWGTLAGAMPAFVYPGYVIEETSISIQCRSIDAARDLQSATSDTTFIAGENCVAVGRPGSWEYIFFRDVTVISPKVVQLTGLIRAQRGTDVAAANHTADDYVVLVASANPTFVSGFRDQSLPTSKANTDYNFTVAGTPSSRPPGSETDHVSGYSLYPFSPCNFSATLAGGNDLNLAWVRRDRLSTTFVSSPTLMSETSEKYDLEVLNGSTVVRTLLDLTSPAYTYTSAQQTADGFTPPLANVRFRVYQKGELGRGFPHEENVDVH